MGRRPKLTQAEIQEIREMYAVKTHPWSVHQIARNFKVSDGTIHKALNGTLSTREDDNTTMKTEQERDKFYCQMCPRSLTTPTMDSTIQVLKNPVFEFWHTELDLLEHYRLAHNLFMVKKLENGFYVVESLRARDSRLIRGIPEP